MRDEGLYLDDILETAESIERFVDGLSKDEFLASDLVSAVLQKLTVIGEASARISDQLKAPYSQIGWRAITGLRNLAVHVYFTVDWNIIWEIVHSNIPELKLEVAEIITNDFPMPDDGSSEG